MIGVYAGLYKVSCDMCCNLVKPKHTVTHKDKSRADICDVCYGRCLAYPKFNAGIKSGDISVSNFMGG